MSKEPYEIDDGLWGATLTYDLLIERYPEFKDRIDEYMSGERFLACECILCIHNAIRREFGVRNRLDLNTIYGGC